MLAVLDVGPVHDSECCGYLFAWSVFGRRLAPASTVAVYLRIVHVR